MASNGAFKQRTIDTHGSVFGAPGSWELYRLLRHVTWRPADRLIPMPARPAQPSAVPCGR